MTDSRDEDRNARQSVCDFGDGATLADLEQFLARVRERGAPDDAHPVVASNARGEITYMVCVTGREAL